MLRGYASEILGLGSQELHPDFMYQFVVLAEKATILHTIVEIVDDLLRRFSKRGELLGKLAIKSEIPRMSDIILQRLEQICTLYVRRILE